MFKINKIAVLLVVSSLISLPLVCSAKTARKAKTDRPVTERVPPKLMAENLQGTWSWGFAIDSVQLDSEKAASEGVGDSAAALAFEAEYFIQNNFTTTLGFAFLPYSDKRDFSVVTENDLTNDIQTSSSDASAIALFGEMGYKKFFPTSTPWYATARLGVSSLLASERSIPNCSNCPSQDIDINGGFYARGGVGARLGNTWTVGLDYKTYFSGDIASSIGLSIAWNSNF
jgi:Outer membrane protein beta-barrel domain